MTEKEERWQEALEKKDEEIRRLEEEKEAAEKEKLEAVSRYSHRIKIKVN